MALKHNTKSMISTIFKNIYFLTKMTKNILLLTVVFFQVFAFAQKKVLDHSDYELWNTVQDEAIAPDGSHVVYSLERGEKDHFLKVHNSKGALVLDYPRGQKGHFTYDSKFMTLTIKAWKDSVIAMKKRKVKKDRLPKDS